MGDVEMMVESEGRRIIRGPRRQIPFILISRVGIIDFFFFQREHVRCPRETWPEAWDRNIRSVFDFGVHSEYVMGNANV